MDYEEKISFLIALYKKGEAIAKESGAVAVHDTYKMWISNNFPTATLYSMRCDNSVEFMMKKRKEEGSPLMTNVMCV